MASNPPPTPAVAPQPAAIARRRDKNTKRSVLIADKIADWTIRIGGVGVILAVFGIMVFLAEVVAPLFLGNRVVGETTFTKPVEQGRIVMDRMDEYKTLSVAVADNGTVKAFHVGTGKEIEVANFDFGNGRVMAFGRTLSGVDVAFGFTDGTVRFGKIQIDVRVLPASEAPKGLTTLNDRDRTDGKAIYSVIPGNQVRRVSVSTSLDAPQAIVESKAIVAIDYRLGGTVERPTQAFVTVDADGVPRLSQTEEKRNLLTGAVRKSVNSTTLPPLPKGTVPTGVLMTEKADQVYVADRGGTIYRYDTRDFEKPVLAEAFDVFPDATQLTTFGFLIGEQSIVVGGSNGAVDVYFRLPRPDAKTADGFTLVRAHRLAPHAAGVVAFAASERGKTFATADADGNLWLRHATSEQTLLKLRAKADDRTKIEALVLAPRDDGVLAIDAYGRVRAWDVSVPHPETTLQSIFGKVWYEGYSEPTYTWQSSSGTDTFEPKFSLVPLIFGTIKATLYSLLFAIPVALLGAIYTSEFVHHTVRATVKPVMEMMASLPSVVLGFIAALILAPIVETWIAAVVLAFVVIPLSLMTAAYLWQILPAPTALRLGGLPKFSLMFVVLGLSSYLAYLLGPAFETLFFAGDFKAWANGDVGSDTPFLFLLLWPATFALTATTATRLWDEPLRTRLRVLPRTRAGAVDVARWLALLLISAVLSYLLAVVLVALGLGARGGLVDTYVQRNTLVVGFAMGFAVIPIIYTIAEDAMNSVPEHLRAASLACGATPWQTAVGVIIPTAVSGIFAAVMIGMGRAVGETMIVVMAAGNTPILEWNIFNGLRALSANIAVELPEAVKDSTLYRMLFLAGMTLFVMTFIVNTLAETIRLRFRKRAAQL
jgi:phosphate transport system permease protein